MYEQVSCLKECLPPYSRTEKRALMETELCLYRTLYFGKWWELDVLIQCALTDETVISKHINNFFSLPKAYIFAHALFPTMKLYQFLPTDS